MKEWRSFSSCDWRDQDLAQVVSEMLTENMARSPRDEERTTLLVVDRSTLRVIGLMILFVIEAEGGNGETELRLAYLLSADTLKQGIASELLTGFVAWCREESPISSIAGGVASDNLASI